jgi:hypothetical protein
VRRGERDRQVVDAKAANLLIEFGQLIAYLWAGSNQTIKSDPVATARKKKRGALPEYADPGSGSRVFFVTV